MNTKQIFFDEKSNVIFEEYKNMKIKKMCINIVELNETLINICDFICIDNIKSVAKYHSSIILVFLKEKKKIYLKIELIHMGIVLRKIKKINNYKCSEIVKMSKRNLLLLEFIDNYKNEIKRTYNIYNYICHTFVNNILKCNKLEIPNHIFIKSLLTHNLKYNKKKFGLSANLAIFILHKTKKWLLPIIQIFNDFFIERLL